jgi:hypothetical protein
MAFILRIKNLLKSPEGFLGGLPRPLRSKHCFIVRLAKLKVYVFEEGFKGLVFILSRRDHFLVCLVLNKTRPDSSYKLFNLGTSQCAYFAVSKYN